MTDSTNEDELRRTLQDRYPLKIGRHRVYVVPEELTRQQLHAIADSCKERSPRHAAALKVWAACRLVQPLRGLTWDDLKAEEARLFPNGDGPMFGAGTSGARA